MKGWDNSQRGPIPRSNRSELRINNLALRLSPRMLRVIEELAGRLALA
jgi:hypothetical protein